MNKIVVFGAGNIGRSLVGDLFSRAGYEVVFVDVADEIVALLNKWRRYRIEVKDVHPQTIRVENVRAVHGENAEKTAYEVATADVLATAVGVNNLPYIYSNIAQGLIKRSELNRGPLDIIICENVRNASEIFREGLRKHLPRNYALDSSVGLVETSIGKMVPIVTTEQKREDPLVIYAEAYSRIILDKKGFKGPVPKVEGLDPKENMSAYVNLKLFVHNMGHAVTAYLGYITDPRMMYIWEAIGNERVRNAVERAMWESGSALILEHPSEFNKENMRASIDDLIRRFDNRALGDTVFRVGRDLPRKLSREDRLVGSLLLDAKHSVPAPFTTLGLAAAMLFRAKDHEGRLDPKDRVFAEEIYPHGIDYVLRKVCGLDSEKDNTIVNNIKRAHGLIAENPGNWHSAGAQI